MDVYGHVLPRLQQQAATEMDAAFDAARKAHRDREEKPQKLSNADPGAATGGNSLDRPLLN